MFINVASASEISPLSLPHALPIYTALFARFFHACLEEGVYLAPSQFEATFVSMAHDAGVIEEACNAFARAFARVR